MKDEYDLSGGQRGFVFRRDTVLIPPIHLDSDIPTSSKGRTQRQGVTLDSLVDMSPRQALGPIGTTGRIDA